MKEFTKQELNTFKRATELYEIGGASSVYDYANEIGLHSWNWCKNCEADTPVIKNFCLVCGQDTEE
jgi:hypothetical protein